MVLGMNRIKALQGRTLATTIASIVQLRQANPCWSRTRLSKELCNQWGWHGANGQIKDMACRNLLRELEQAGHIELPAQRSEPPVHRRRPLVRIAHRTDELCASIESQRPLSIDCVQPGTEAAGLCDWLLASYHYLGHRRCAGKNLKYLVRGCSGRLLACLQFASAALKCTARDAYIGWEPQTRAENLDYMADNTRFLVLPWVKVPHLASHLLSCIACRIGGDWQDKYGHSLYCLESFVDRSRYRGVCYQAANWRLVGQSLGRGRNDRYHRRKVAPKDVYIYPLVRDFRRWLCDES